MFSPWLSFADPGLPENRVICRVTRHRRVIADLLLPADDSHEVAPVDTVKSARMVAAQRLVARRSHNRKDQLLDADCQSWQPDCDSGPIVRYDGFVRRAV